MDKIEFKTLRKELSNEVLNIEKQDLLIRVQRYLKRIMSEQEKYIKKQEAFNAIKECLLEFRDENIEEMQ